MTSPVTYSSQIIPTLISMAICYGFCLAGWMIIRITRRRIREVTK